MPDIVAPHIRSRMMAGIRGRDTKPEITLRHHLHRAGFRYRVHAAGIPGRPDLVFPKYNAIIFAHGCFWHGHDCALFRWPASRQEFWREKITGNVTRDASTRARLLGMGWRVLVVWECALKGSGRLPLGLVIDQVAAWLRSDGQNTEIRGTK